MKRLVIDTETTGLSPHTNKTLTVGMMLIDVEKDFLKILDKSHTFIKHDFYNHNAKAQKVHKIDMEMHDKMAVHPKSACEEINAFISKNSLQDTTIVGHNIGFDKGFLKALFTQGNCDCHIHENSEDTLSIWRNLQKKELVPQDLRGTLGTVSDYFGIDYSRAHDALEDAHITAQVYHKMMKLE